MPRDAPTAPLRVLALLAACRALPAAAQCSVGGDNCNVTKCCEDSSFMCFEKNPEFAKCTASCEPGKHAGDPPDYRTPWSCKVLDTCSSGDYNCMDTKCCKDPAMTCYAKDGHYAKCLPSCEPGIHDDDPPEYQQEWSCKVEDAGAAASAGDGGSSGGAAAGAADSGGEAGKGKCGGVFAKCGGKNWKGSTCCETGCTCQNFGVYYSSCRPPSGHSCTAAAADIGLSSILDGPALAASIETRRHSFGVSSIMWMGAGLAVVLVAGAFALRIPIGRHGGLLSRYYQRTALGPDQPHGAQQSARDVARCHQGERLCNTQGLSV